MGQAALKYEQEPQETLLIPDGGIASFLTATEGDWADEEALPQNGIAQVTHIADRLAEYGRHEDEYMVHAAEGETVIPMAVLEANPRLRKSLFAQMEMMGLEPESYVVGSELNSINPITGQPEFFLKKLFKGVKKLVKKVVKVVKKALPVILPIALSFTPLGPVFGSALGSGIGTLMQGGSFKDALKASVIAGGIGGLTAGLKGGFGAKDVGQTFGEGFRTGVGDAFGNVGQRFGQALGGARPTDAPYFGDPFRSIKAPTTPTVDASGLVSTGTETGTGAITSRTPSPGIPRQGIVTVDPVSGRPVTAGAPSTSQLQYQDYNVQPSIEQADTTPQLTGADPTTLALERDATARAGASPGTLGTSTAATQQSAGAGQVDAGVDQNILDSLRTRADSNIAERGYDYLTAAGKTPAELAEAANTASNTAIQNSLSPYDYTSIGQVLKDVQAGKIPEAFGQKIMTDAATAGNAAAAASGPNMLTRFGPSVALAGIGAAGAGLFDPPETEDEEDPFKDYKYTPSLYGFQAPPTYTLGDIRVPGREVGFGADGGGIASLEEFPRRSGRIAGPGTERSDDVPAMLSDGEFVMTAKAVRGAGKGNRNNGMKNMYQMMRTFEASA
jgi:hypothetical protein